MAKVALIRRPGAHAGGERGDGGGGGGGGGVTVVSSVDTKSDPWVRFGNDSVDTKPTDSGIFGNDAVDTKGRAIATFGNDATIGFIRTRKRKIKGGHPDWREYRALNGKLATTSISFDLVRAVRVNGKPRHEFVLGFGSQ